jgi:hypothetical protein
MRVVSCQLHIGVETETLRLRQSWVGIRLFDVVWTPTAAGEVRRSGNCCHRRGSAHVFASCGSHGKLHTRDSNPGHKNVRAKKLKKSCLRKKNKKKNFNSTTIDHVAPDESESLQPLGRRRR